MKKILALLLVVGLLLLGCLTTEQSNDKQVGVYNPSVNVFEDRSWIKYEPLELFQDDEYLYFHLKYTSERDGKFSLFNPPNGGKFKILGDMAKGSGQIIEKVSKNDLAGVNEITILLFPGGYSNDAERTGFFFKATEIKFNQIPSIYDGLISALEEKIDMTKTVKKEEPNTSSVKLQPKLTKEEFISKIKDLDIETAGKEEILKLLGKPDYIKNDYLLSYLNEEFMVDMNKDDSIAEIRFSEDWFESTEGFKIGEHMDKIFSVIGKPTDYKDFTNWKDVEANTNIVYKFPEGHYYYINKEHKFRLFTEIDNDGIVGSIYLLSSHSHLLE